MGNCVVCDQEISQEKEKNFNTSHPNKITRLKLSFLKISNFYNTILKHIWRRENDGDVSQDLEIIPTLTNFKRQLQNNNIVKIA